MSELGPMVFVLEIAPSNEDEIPRTMTKVAQVYQALREDGVQVVGVSVHTRYSAQRVLAVARE